MKTLICLIIIVFILTSCSKETGISPDITHKFNPIKVINGTWDITTTKYGSKRVDMWATDKKLNDGEWTYEGYWSGNTFKGNYSNAPYEAYMSITVESETRLSGFMSLKITIPGATQSTSDNFIGKKVK